MFPLAEYNNLPPAWVREYTVSGLSVHDPVMAWAYRNCGIARWSEIGEADSQGVLELAKVHGLNFGAVACCTDGNGAGERSFGFFCRSDREYADSELDTLSTLLNTAHRLHARPCSLTVAERETLGLVKNGLLMKQIAATLGVSESAIKQRLKSARVKLNARTGSQAAVMATMLGVI